MKSNMKNKQEEKHTFQRSKDFPNACSVCGYSIAKSIHKEEKKQMEKCYCQCHALENFGWDQKTTFCDHCIDSVVTVTPPTDTHKEGCFIDMGNGTCGGKIEHFCSKHFSKMIKSSQIDGIQAERDKADKVWSIAMVEAVKQAREEERERLRKAVEGMRLDSVDKIYGQSEIEHGFETAYNKALDDVLKILEEKEERTKGE